MHLVLLTTGTRGDVDPFVALGMGLRDAGHRVTLATHDDFRDLVLARGLGFRRITGSFRAIVESPQGRKWIESAESLTRYRKTFEETFAPWWEPWLRDIHEACVDADAVVFHLFCCSAFHTAEKRGIPAMCASFIPIQPTAFIPPIYMPGAPQWGWLRRWLQLKAHDMFGEIALPHHQKHRAALGLPPLTSKRLWIDMAARRVPFMHLYCETLEARPADWPEHVSVTGACTMPLGPGWKPPRELEAFLGAGDPPVYVGFGSMTGRDPAELSALVVEAVGAAGVRAVVGTGWGGIDGQSLPDRVHRVDDVPHAWLFPRVSAVVHHGGVGTTTAGLRAGKPTQVVPFFGDQLYWGTRVARLGAGPDPLPKRRLTAARLAERIRALLKEPRWTEGAMRAQAAMAAEPDGVARAVETISRYLS